METPTGHQGQGLGRGQSALVIASRERRRVNGSPKVSGRRRADGTPVASAVSGLADQLRTHDLLTGLLP